MTLLMDSLSAAPRRYDNLMSDVTEFPLRSIDDGYFVLLSFPHFQFSASRPIPKVTELSDDGSAGALSLIINKN